MRAVKGVWLALAAVCLLAVSRAAAASSHPGRSALGGAVLGVAALGLVNLTAAFTGVSLPFNWFTAFTSVVLGAPGVVGLLVLGMVL